MTWIKGILIFTMLLRAVYTDIRERRIENRLLAAGAVTGLLFQVFTGNQETVFRSIKSAVLMFAALFFLYFIRGLGAGDIKLLCVLALFFGRDSMGIVIVSFFAAAVVAVLRMLWRFVRNEKIYQKGETLRFSIPVTISTAIIFLQEVCK